MNSWEITVLYTYIEEIGIHQSTARYDGQTDIDAINDMLEFYSCTNRKVIKIDEIYKLGVAGIEREVDGVKYVVVPEIVIGDCLGCVGNTGYKTDWDYEKCQSLCDNLRTADFCIGLGIWVEA